MYENRHMSKKLDNMLEPFFLDPEREYHVREIAKITKKAPTTVSKTLKEYSKRGILQSRNALNHLLFKASTQEHAYKQLKLHYNLTKLHSSGLINYLEKEYKYPMAIVLFGSYAKAEDIFASDIDILVVTPTKKNISVNQFEKVLGHKVQLHCYSPQALEAMKTKNKELLNTFINGVLLSGYLELFQ